MVSMQVSRYRHDGKYAGNQVTGMIDLDTGWHDDFLSVNIIVIME
jgi:hypothetical protein